MKRLPWNTVAVIAGLFTVMIAAAMLANLGPLRAADPLGGGDLAAMKAELALRPKDEALKTAIRDRDAAMRSHWFTRVGTAQRGAWVLLIGLAVTVAALKLARRQDDVPFDPRAVAPPEPHRAAAAGRWGLVSGGVMLVAGLAVLGAGHVAEAPPPVVTVRLPPPDPAEVARNWPGFRGPAAGLAAGAAPTAWDGASGTDVLWQVATGLPGHGSPAVWGDSVFLSGSDGKAQEVTAYATIDGARRWTCRIPLPAGATVEAFSDTGHAAPSPASDGRRVVALFASGVLAAVSVDGRLEWSRALGVPDSQYTLAASPAIWRDRVLVQLDQGAPDAKRSALLAFDLASGRQLWRTTRPVGASWSSPLVAELAGRWQVITCADPWVIAYAPDDGHELWRAKVLSGDVAPTPAIAGGLVVVANMGARIAAIRPDGSGDVTATHLAWSGEDELPDMASPVADATLVATVAPSGTITCHDAATGAVLWSQPGEGVVRASPVVAGNRLYVTDENGLTRILAWGRTLQPVATAALGEKVSATMAVVGGRIYLRGEQHLFCLGEKK